MNVPRALLVVTMLFACTAGRAPAQEAPADPMAVAQGALNQLDQLRVVGSPHPERALELLKRGTEALAQGKQVVADDAAPPASAPAAGRNRRPDPAQNAAAAQRRLQLCHIAFMQAELHRRTALAVPADHPQRLVQLELALAQYKQLRIEYRDLVAGRLGYAGEARVHRARGDLAQADAVLSNIAIELDEKRIAQQSAPALQVQRVLWLERLETALARGGAAGGEMAASLEDSPLFKDAPPAEQAALRWTAAQAAAIAATAAGGDAKDVAQRLRDPALAEAAPEHQRVALLVKLAGKGGVKLTAAEQLAWARLQAWAGMTDDAMATYAAAATPGADAKDVSPADWLAYGALLHAAGRADAAADALAKGQASIPSDSPQRLPTLQAIAAGRVQAARQKGAGDAQRKLAIDALWQLAEETPDAQVRRDALRSWAHLHQQARTLDAQLSALAKFDDAVNADPYLYLLTGDARWRSATSPATTRPTTRPSPQLAQEIHDNLARLLPEADEQLAASLVLLMAQTAAVADPAGARAALDVLAQHQALIKPDAPATPQVQALRLRLLMDLGLSAEAEALARELQTSGAVPTATALKLADMLADRHAGAADVPQGARDQVVQLVSRGLAQRARDAKYRDSALSAATTLLKVKAYADAQQVLDGLRAAGTPLEKDPPVALVSAAALQGLGKVEEAQRILTAVAREHPQSGEVHLATARLQHQLQQWEPAAEAYRLARKELRAGGEPWWQATVGLGEALSQQGNAAGAQELLRVANAMYRSRAPASLLPRIDALLKPASAGAGAAGNTGRVGGGRNG